ncbi:MAG TPA: FHA domain-containing protein, partial [Mycobacteriales bacterium]|nr:FHA domain-containing protein [Mycobacteriales bacterium]
MAAVTYRCPVDPDTCQTSAGPGFCPTHHQPMERIRPRFPQPAEPPAEPASPRPEASPHTGGPGPRAAGVLAAEARIPVRWSVQVLGRDIVVPSAGVLVVGREQEPFASLPGMAEQLYVSRRRHAQLYRVGDTLRLVDLGSTNGTFLDSM